MVSFYCQMCSCLLLNTDTNIIFIWFVVCRCTRKKEQPSMEIYIQEATVWGFGQDTECTKVSHLSSFHSKLCACCQTQPCIEADASTCSGWPGLLTLDMNYTPSTSLTKSISDNYNTSAESDRAQMTWRKGCRQEQPSKPPSSFLARLYFYFSELPKSHPNMMQR